MRQTKLASTLVDFLTHINISTLIWFDLICYSRTARQYEDSLKMNDDDLVEKDHWPAAVA